MTDEQKAEALADLLVRLHGAQVAIRKCEEATRQQGEAASLTAVQIARFADALQILKRRQGGATMTARG